MAKVDSKKLYDFVLDSGGSVEDAVSTVLLNNYGKRFFTALVTAEERYGINLMPCDCIAVLEEVYGKSLDLMLHKTIFKKVRMMMCQVESNPDEDIIMESINYYMCSV